MNNDFDFPADFDATEEEFPEFDHEIDLNDLLVRTAVLQKTIWSLLCIKSASEGAAICRVDPRENNPSVQLYDDPTAAIEWFTKSLRTSRRNGWNVIYDGLPLQG